MLTKRKQMLLETSNRQNEISFNHNNFKGYVLCHFIYCSFLDNDIRPDDGPVKAETCSQFKIQHLVNK